MVLTEETVWKRLKGLRGSQESIEAVSLWCGHHSGESSLIASVWISAFRTGGEDERLALLYLANHVAQRAKPSTQSLRDALAPRLEEALALVRHQPNLLPKAQRLMGIWEERRSFEASTLASFRHQLQMTFDDAPEVAPKYLLQFEPPVLLAELAKAERAEGALEAAQALVPDDAPQGRSLKTTLKDRREGGRVLAELDESASKTSALVGALEEQLEAQHRLLALLEAARSFYAQQIKDATVVHEAYLNFADGIRDVGSQLSARLSVQPLPASHTNSALVDMDLEQEEEPPSDPRLRHQTLPPPPIPPNAAFPIPPPRPPPGPPPPFLQPPPSFPSYPPHPPPQPQPQPNFPSPWQAGQPPTDYHQSPPSIVPVNVPQPTIVSVNIQPQPTESNSWRRREEPSPKSARLEEDNREAQSGWAARW